MLPDRVSNPGPLTYESGALPIALRGPARNLTLPFGEVRFKIVFLTRHKQIMTFKRTLNRPCDVFSHLFRNYIEHFDVSGRHFLRQTRNLTRNGSKTARFTPGHFLEMVILYFI